MADDDWVYDALCTYFNSSDWSGVVGGFIQEHAGLFLPSSSAPLELKHAAFGQYRDLTSALLASCLSELGVSTKQCEAVFRRHSRAEAAEQGFRQISATDSFAAFSDYMLTQAEQPRAEPRANTRGLWDPDPRPGQRAAQRPEEPRQRSPLPNFRHEMLPARGSAGPAARAERADRAEADWQMREAVRLSREEKAQREVEEELAQLELALAISLSLSPEDEQQRLGLEDEAEERAMDIVRQAQLTDGKTSPSVPRGRPVPPATQPAPSPAAGGSLAPPPAHWSGSPNLREQAQQHFAARRPPAVPPAPRLSTSPARSGGSQPQRTGGEEAAGRELEGLAPLPPPRDASDSEARAAFEAEIERVSEILPGFLYLGSAKGAAKRALLARLDVHLVINVSRKCPNLYQGDFQYVHWEIKDSLEQNIAQYFPECNRIIAEAKRAGKVVFVHCMQGVSRSATLVLAYLMGVEGMSLRDALQLVHNARPIACPNRSFFAQLLRYEMELFGGQSSIHPHVAHAAHAAARRIEPVR